MWVQGVRVRNSNKSGSQDCLIPNFFVHTQPKKNEEKNYKMALSGRSLASSQDFQNLVPLPPFGCSLGVPPFFGTILHKKLTKEHLSFKKNAISFPPAPCPLSFSPHLKPSSLPHIPPSFPFQKNPELPSSPKLWVRRDKHTRTVTAVVEVKLS